MSLTRPVVLILGAFFFAVNALTPRRFLSSRELQQPGASLVQVNYVYDSLNSTVSWPAVKSTDENDFDVDTHRLCVPPAVGGCSLLEDHSFVSQVHDGLEAISSKGIVIAGLLRDDGDATGQLLKSLHTVGNAFARHHLIIIENDSKDTTRKNMARECKGPDAWCFETSLKALGPKQNENVPHRIQHLSWLRQQLLDQVRRFVSTSTEVWDFMLVFDGDLFSEGNGGFDPMATLSLFGYRQEGGAVLADKPPDVVCSNGIMNWWAGAGRFRDTFALRVKSFNETHVAGQEDFYYKGNELVPLKSCFSGLSLYSLPGLLQSQCGYKYQNEDTCEHVALHRCLAEHGHGHVAVYPPWTVRFNNEGVDPQACTRLKPDKGIDGCADEGFS